MNPRVLIVGTVPYNEKSTSRAFASYFSGWEKENLAQIFSNAKAPVKGHCGTLFQITDQRLVQRRLNKSICTGRVYNYEQLETEWTDNALETKNGLFTNLYRLGSRKFPLNYLLRKILWNKKYWNTPELNSWLDAFRPECVFLSFSDDIFIPEIALYVAEKYNIPIVSSIGDDYYFNDRFSISPFYYLYRNLYKKLIDRVFEHKGSAIYIGDKIRDQYNNHFGLDGETVYLTSTVERQVFRPIRTQEPKIVYCGNIRLGRNYALIDIARALEQIDPAYRIDVYSNEADRKFYSVFESQKNIVFHGSVPYRQVQEEIENSDIVLVVEGFKKRDVDITRFSLSTKVADSLASGRFVLAYGSSECGAIEYMKQIDCGLTCTSFQELNEKLPHIFLDTEYQKEMWLRAVEITEQNHRLSKSTEIFRGVIKKAIHNYGGENDTTVAR